MCMGYFANGIAPVFNYNAGVDTFHNGQVKFVSGIFPMLLQEI